MPGSTENFAIPYPCAGEVIDCNIFGAWASGIDAALEVVAQASEESARRPRAMLRTVDTGVSVPVGGAFTGMIYNRGLFGNPIYNEGLTLTGVFPSFTGFTLSAPMVPGWYLFICQFTPLNAATTVTSFEGRITVNGFVHGRTLGDSAPSTVARPISVMGMGLVNATGATATASFGWTGTGGPISIYSQFSCSFVAPDN